MSFSGDDRAMGIIRVLVLFAASMFSLWILVLVIGGVLEPIYEIVLDDDAVQEWGATTAVELAWPIMSQWAPLLFAVGMICLVIIYSVFREQFSGPARGPGP